MSGVMRVKISLYFALGLGLVLKEERSFFSLLQKFCTVIPTNSEGRHELTLTYPVNYTGITKIIYLLDYGQGAGNDLPSFRWSTRSNFQGHQFDSTRKP